jgi:hypothetical protein
VKTIARSSTRKIAAIMKRNPTCEMFSLRNNFTPQDVDPAWAWGELDRFDFARLIEIDDNTWQITVHSNLWYKLRAAPRAPG